MARTACTAQRVCVSAEHSMHRAKDVHDLQCHTMRLQHCFVCSSLHRLHQYPYKCNQPSISSAEGLCCHLATCMLPAQGTAVFEAVMFAHCVNSSSSPCSSDPKTWQRNDAPRVSVVYKPAATLLGQQSPAMKHATHICRDVVGTLWGPHQHRATCSRPCAR
jgi:hypothetical protein